MPVLNSPYRFSDAAAGVHGRPAFRGEDNRDVLRTVCWVWPTEEIAPARGATACSRAACRQAQADALVRMSGLERSSQGAPDEALRQHHRPELRAACASFLAEKGSRCPLEQVASRSGVNRQPEFLAKNPMGGLPACSSSTTAACICARAGRDLRVLRGQENPSRPLTRPHARGAPRRAHVGASAWSSK